jgi:subtilisin family serine protease
MYRKIFTILSIVLVLAFAFSTISLASAQPTLKVNQGGQVEESPNGIYIIQMINDPVVAYQGDIPGLPATKPNKGEKINPNSANVVKYAAFLMGKHDEALSKAGGKKLYDYVYTYNGFAAQLNLQQANKMASLDGVMLVSPDELQNVDTSSTPSFLGLDAPGGLWDQLGGLGSGGEDVIIGIVDSGIWPESLSFTDRVDENGIPSAKGKKVYQQIPGWHGKCTPGEGFNASMCNQKLIGAQRFNAAWGGDRALEAERPWEFMSPRDYNGHGSHTASTAGGNYGTPTTGPATMFGSISGMAPRARIATYKALWSSEDASTASGFTSDLVAAIDQAVRDGVDVINYSISGTRTSFLEPVQVSFLFAADAGVFVAASAGNAGPTTSTVAHPGPWLTTVAAGTHNRNGSGSVTLGDGTTYFGASLATAVGPAPLIDSTAAGLPGADPTQVALCYSTVDTGGAPVLDPALVAGKIVVCDRGVTARVNKSLAVLEAGGVGMILLNPPPAAGSLNADFHFVPTVHLQFTDYAAIHAYAATPDATATINQATIIFNEPAPFTAAFSSRGPLLAGGGDLLKPDVMAPGVDVLASVAPPGNHGFDFNMYSGTSMSAPHVAGLAALLKDLHPSWSPMAIKSALMTTGYDVLDGGTPAPNTNPILIFRQGAGHANPNSAADPGLVYDHGFLDWLAFLCGTTTGVNPATCNALAGMGYSFDPSDLNVASIAIGDLPGGQTVRRTVTNVGGGTATYNVSVSGMVGFNVSVDPSTLTLAPGESASYTVTFANVSAPLNTYTGGQLTWSDGGHNVRIPLVVRPVALGAPASVFSNGDPISYNVSFGYTGAFTASPRGLIPAEVTAGTVDQDPDQTFNPADPTGTVAIPVVIPAGSTYARFSLFDEDVTPGSDIDLYIYQGTTLVGASTSPTSTEEVNFTFATPTASPIALTAYVHGWGVAGGGSTPFKLYFWGLGTADAGNMTVSAPASAVIGTTGTIELTFSGLDPAKKYLGSVAYSGISGLPNPTIVRVDTP